MFGVLLIGPAAMSISDLLPATTAYPGEATLTAVAPGRCGDVFVLLFDELAHDAVFSGDRSTLGSLASLTASARVYHRASSATISTGTSIAKYLSAPTDRSGSRDTIATGPTGLARRLGLHTDVIGWYFPYCEVLGTYAERCRSFSMYNAAITARARDTPAPTIATCRWWSTRLAAHGKTSTSPCRYQTS